MARLNPQRMAEIYWSRMGRRAIRDIDAILSQYKDAPITRDYWLVVRSFIEGCGQKGNS